MIGMLASRVAFVQYRLMLVYSLRDDPMMAQLTMKNVVLITSILILTYGLYVPKSWRRAALVVGPLALLPFATLLALYLRHPEAMGWLGQGVDEERATARLALFSFDAMLLLIAGRRLRVRGPHDLAAAPAGRRGPATRPVSAPAAHRRRRDG